MSKAACPKCNSPQINLVSANYPKEFACKACGQMFVESKPALIDE